MEVKILINRWKSRTVGFKFDMHAWVNLCEMNGIEIHQLGELSQEKMMADLIYSAYVSYCTSKLKKVKFTYEQFGGIIDKMNKGQTEQLGKEILQSRVMGKAIGDYAEKKKQK